MSKHSKSKKKNIYDEYRRILQKPDLTKEEIDKMRLNIFQNSKPGKSQKTCDATYKEKNQKKRKMLTKNDKRLN